MLTNEELEKIFAHKSQSEVLQEEICALEKELGINQIPSKQDFVSERTLWERFNLWIGFASQASIDQKRLLRYDRLEVCRNIRRNGDLVVVNPDFGYTRRLSEEDAVLMCQRKLDRLKKLKAENKKS
ncbi:hypothetical protein AWB71_05265 [Caballeronia peredens]|nr:hypothetical protein AWB71_05265 [Caballeronia peredens]